MQVNMEVENTHNGESEQANSADDRIMGRETEMLVNRTVQQAIVPTIGELVQKIVEGIHSGGSEQASRIMGREIEMLVIRTVEQVIVPTLGKSVRKIVKEEIQSSVEKRLLTGGTRNFANEMTMPKERSLQLKFLDEVSVPVLTGKLIQGKGGDHLNVALVDGTTGQIVNYGPESSAKVEILVLDASGDDDAYNLTRENFKNKIIRGCDKEKPHFAKSINIYLKEGIGILSNAKLGHVSTWMKICKCRLGARIMESFRGIEVHEAWTESFIVSDRRSEFYKKHYPPSLSDEIWRLKNIARDGDLRKRLNKKKICEVRDFLFLHSVDPQRLEQIASDGTKTWKPTMWKATVDHAQKCIIDDKNIYMYYPSTESKMGVIFYAVGGLKGVICESHYVPIENISADEKVSARELLLSAFENQKDQTSFNDEASFLQKYPYRSANVNASTNPSIEGSNDNDLTTANIDEYFRSEPGTSSQSIIPYIRPPDHSNIIDQFSSLGSTETGQLYVDANLRAPVHNQSCQFSDFENINAFASTDPGTSSQSIIPCVRTSDHPNYIHCFGSLESIDIMNGPLWSPVLSFPDPENINGYAHIDPGISSRSMSPSIRTFDLPNNCSHFDSLSVPYSGVQLPSFQPSYTDLILESSSGDWSSLVNSKINNISEALGAESKFHRQNNARALRLIGLVVNAVLWGVRVKKKVMALALEGIHVQKKQRTVKKKVTASALEGIHVQKKQRT